MVARIRNKQIHVKLNEAAKEFLIEKGYDPTYGARPMRRRWRNIWKIPWPRNYCAATSRRTTRSMWFRKAQGWASMSSLPKRAPTNPPARRVNLGPRAGDGGRFVGRALRLPGQSAIPGGRKPPADASYTTG